MRKTSKRRCLCALRGGVAGGGGVPPKNEGSSSIILEHLVPGNAHPKCLGLPAMPLKREGWV